MEKGSGASKSAKNSQKVPRVAKPQKIYLKLFLGHPVIRWHVNFRLKRALENTPTTLIPKDLLLRHGTKDHALCFWFCNPSLRVRAPKLKLRYIAQMEPGDIVPVRWQTPWVFRIISKCECGKWHLSSLGAWWVTAQVPGRRCVNVCTTTT